jgi:hypothetical protein
MAEIVVGRRPFFNTDLFERRDLARPARPQRDQ